MTKAVKAELRSTFYVNFECELFPGSSLCRMDGWLWDSTKNEATLVI